MKRITALILALVMTLCAFALVGCEDKNPPDNGSNNAGNNAGNEGNNGGNEGNNAGNEGSGDQEESVYAQVAAAIEKTLKAKSYEANLDILLKTDYLGNKSEVSTQANVKAAALDSKPQMIYDGTSTEMGTPASMDYYYDGQWSYVSMDGEPAYKQEIAYAAFTKELDAPQNFIIALSEALFASAQSQKNSDGSLTVTLALDEANIESLYKDAVTAIVYDIVGEDLNQTTTKDATIVITVADGYVREYKVSFVSEIVAGSDKVVYEFSKAIGFVSCDKDVAITPPANLDEYYEMSWG